MLNSQSLSKIKKYLGLLVVALLFTGCASLPVDFERSESFALQYTGDTRLAKALEPIKASHDQAGFYLLSDGIGAFVARIALLEAAEKSLDVQYSIWHDDLTGKVLHNRLLHSADRGVRVRLLLDDLDTAGKETTLRILDAHPGIEIRLFNPFANRNARASDFVTDLGRVNRRMHNNVCAYFADVQSPLLSSLNIDLL